jgi:hypothetical protein
MTRAVQIPEMHFDMDTTGNGYCDSTGACSGGVTGSPNEMVVGTIDSCLTSATADTATHIHPTHLILKNTEDLVAWTARVNFIGDKWRVAAFNATPFNDVDPFFTNVPVGFVNLPNDSGPGTHRAIIQAIEGNALPPAPADGSNTPQTTAFGAIYNGSQSFAISPDTPHKATPDDSSYNAPNGGILASVVLQVVGDESGNNLFMNLDDDFPNGPLGSELEIFTGTGQQTVTIPPERLGDAFHGEGVTCAPQDCTTQECPPTTLTPPPTEPPTPTPPPQTPTPTPTPVGQTPTPAGQTPTPAGQTPTPAGQTPTPAGRTPTPRRATPAALPPTGATSDGDMAGLPYILLLSTALAVPGSGAAFVIWRLRRTQSS